MGGASAIPIFLFTVFLSRTPVYFHSTIHNTVGFVEYADGRRGVWMDVDYRTSDVKGVGRGWIRDGATRDDSILNEIMFLP